MSSGFSVVLLLALSLVSATIGFALDITGKRPGLSSEDSSKIDAIHRAYSKAWLQGEEAGVLSHSDEPRVGMAAIKQFWFPTGSLPVKITKLDLKTDETGGSGDLAFSRAVLQLSPNSQRNVYQGFVFLKKGMLRDAAALASTAEGVVDQSPATLGIAGYLYGRAGRRLNALRVLHKVERMSRRSFVSPTILAWVHAGLGDRDQAIARLEEACQHRDNILTGLQLYPVFDPLRDDPRFEGLLRRMNFPRR